MKIDNQRNAERHCDVEVIPVRGKKHRIRFDARENFILRPPLPKELPLQSRNVAEVLLCKVGEARHGSDDLHPVRLQAAH